MIGAVWRGTRARGALILVLGAWLAVPRTGAAQQQATRWDYRALDLTRAQLERVLARYQAAAVSNAYSPALRARAARAVDAIQNRMREGDIRVGDRLRLTVDGQPTLSDTFPVLAGPRIELPVVGSVSLRGVLRSELEARLRASVDSVYRNVEVRVQSLITLAVVGGVAKPGFYAMRKDALIQDAIGAAGGLSASALLAGAYIERGRTRVVGPDSLQAIIRDGRTIGVLGLEPGDQLYIPVQTQRNALEFVQVLSYAVTLPLSFYTLYQLVK
jgi:protein involved in polysaccharide export with SLBB domain